MFPTGKTLVTVASNDSKVCSNLAGGAKVLFPGGRWSYHGNFYLLLGKELEGKHIYQNVQKHRIGGDRKQNKNSQATIFGVN